MKKEFKFTCNLTGKQFTLDELVEFQNKKGVWASKRLVEKYGLEKLDNDQIIWWCGKGLSVDEALKKTEKEYKIDLIQLNLENCLCEFDKLVQNLIEVGRKVTLADDAIQELEAKLLELKEDWEDENTISG